VLPLLRVQALRLILPGETNRIAPVDGVSFDIRPAECVGLVGESGCGKSLTALSILGLARSLPGAQTSGSALWQGTRGRGVNLLKLSERELSRVRGAQIAMVFQDPLSSLNPVLRVDYQLSEVLRRHKRASRLFVRRRIIELLKRVGVPQPEERAHQYPHQLSGGLRQRVMLAMALAGEPQLLIADEPTTALDVTVQAQILQELRGLRETQGMAILFITHDLGVVAQLCDRVLVMYAGRIVESAPVSSFFAHPRHPYSQGLLSSLPSVVAKQEQLTCIPGSPPRPDEFPAGCRFHPRCPLARERCRRDYPSFVSVGEHRLACWEHQRAAAQPVATTADS